jgi:hypothetical protein
VVQFGIGLMTPSIQHIEEGAFPLAVGAEDRYRAPPGARPDLHCLDSKPNTEPPAEAARQRGQGPCAMSDIFHAHTITQWISFTYSIRTPKTCPLGGAIAYGLPVVAAEGLRLDQDATRS